MNILRILDDMEAVIERGKKPLLQNDKVIIETDVLYQYIDQLRSSLPDDIRDAQWVKKEEQRILESAKQEYQQIIDEAQEYASKIADNTEIVKIAQQKAEDILREAENTAHQLTEGAFVYAHDIMEKIEKQLTIYYEVVQEGKSEIQQSLEALNNNNQ